MGWQELSDRLARLERENRILRRWIVVAAIGAVTSIVLGLGQVATATNTQDVLEARRFVLRDIVNRERAVLAVDAKGLARLTFFPEDGSVGTTISEKAGVVSP
jgi:hypothetical protein